MKDNIYSTVINMLKNFLFNVKKFRYEIRFFWVEFFRNKKNPT